MTAMKEKVQKHRELQRYALREAVKFLVAGGSEATVSEGDLFKQFGVHVTGIEYPNFAALREAAFSEGFGVEHLVTDRAVKIFRRQERRKSAAASVSKPVPAPANVEPVPLPPHLASALKKISSAPAQVNEGAVQSPTKPKEPTTDQIVEESARLRGLLKRAGMVIGVSQSVALAVVNLRRDELPDAQTLGLLGRAHARDSQEHGMPLSPAEALTAVRKSFSGSHR